MRFLPSSGPEFLSVQEIMKNPEVLAAASEAEFDAQEGVAVAQHWSPEVVAPTFRHYILDVWTNDAGASFSARSRISFARIGVRALRPRGYGRLTRRE